MVVGVISFLVADTSTHKTRTSWSLSSFECEVLDKGILSQQLSQELGLA
jgi:hypothetical protein